MCQVDLNDFIMGTSGGVTLEWSETCTCVEVDCPCLNPNVNPSTPLLTGGPWTTNGVVDFTGATAGSYNFYYRTGDHCVADHCEDCNVLVVTIEEGPDAPCTDALTACDKAGCGAPEIINIYDSIITAACFVSPAIGAKADLIALFSSLVATLPCSGEFTPGGGEKYTGAVTASGTCATNFNCATGDFDPCGCGAGAATLTFDITNPDIDVPAGVVCPSCEEQFIITVNISAGDSAGTPENAVLCN